MPYIRLPLLPVIMRNQDALELTEEQFAAFSAWRKMNYQRMVDGMNAIIGKRITVSRMALDPSVSSEEIARWQDEIFARHREVLRIRLGCRKLVMDTFTHQQWENFRFVIQDYPNLAGLLD